MGESQLFQCILFVQFYLLTSEKIPFFSACNCNTDGSDDTTCDNSGLCSCKDNVVNDKCDECASHHFNYPLCEGKLTHSTLYTYI